MSLEVREATPDDLGPLIGSVAGLFAEDGGIRDEYMDVTWPERQGHDYYRKAVEDPGTLCLLAVDGAVHGHLIGRMKQRDALRPGAVTATLESMRVAEAARGKGVGTALHDAFLAWARRQGANEVEVHAYASNSVAVEFYRSRGYQPHVVGLRLVE